MSAKKKGIDHIQEFKSDELLSLAIFGAFVGGIRHEYGVYKEFKPLGIVAGAVTFTMSGFMASSPEAIVGLFIYNVEGAFLATIAGSSIEAAFLTLVSSASFSYPVMLTSATTGFFIHGIRRIVSDSDIMNETLEGFMSFFSSGYQNIGLFGKLIDNELETA